MQNDGEAPVQAEGAEVVTNEKPVEVPDPVTAARDRMGSAASELRQKIAEQPHGLGEEDQAAAAEEVIAGVQQKLDNKDLEGAKGVALEGKQGAEAADNVVNAVKQEDVDLAA